MVKTQKLNFTSFLFTYLVKKAVFGERLTFFKRILLSGCIKELNCAINSLLKPSIHLLGSFANWVFTLQTSQYVEKDKIPGNEGAKS